MASPRLGTGHSSTDISTALIVQALGGCDWLANVAVVHFAAHGACLIGRNPVSGLRRICSTGLSAACPIGHTLAVARPTSSARSFRASKWTHVGLWHARSAREMTSFIAYLFDASSSVFIVLWKSKALGQRDRRRANTSIYLCEVLCLRPKQLSTVLRIFRLQSNRLLEITSLLQIACKFCAAGSGSSSSNPRTRSTVSSAVFPASLRNSFASSFSSMSQPLDVQHLSVHLIRG